MVKNVNLPKINRIFSATGFSWIWLSILVLIVDLSSKFIIFYNFSLGERISVFTFLNLYYIKNYGVAFSFLDNIHNYYWQRYFLISITIIVCITLFLSMYYSKASNKLNNTACALIFGGTLGNMFDRLWHGFVIDMIDFHIKNFHFATFNLADTAIFIGSMVIISKIFLEERQNYN